MRDLDLSNRDLYGNVTFKLKSSYVYGIENIIQKVTTLLLSENKVTYYGTIYGSDITLAGKFNYNSSSLVDFKIDLTNSIESIVNSIQKDENKNNIPKSDRLQSIKIKDVLFDKITLKVYLSLIISTNSATKIIQLPVKS